MSEALDKIQADAMEFFDGVDRVRRATTFNGGDVKDAYNRLNRVRERDLSEKDNRKLTSVEDEELGKVFENDVFINGMLDARQIGEHVQKRSGGGPVIRLKNGRPIPLSAKTSAGSFFPGSTVIVQDAHGKTHYVDHRELLEVAEQRVRKALERAQKS